MEAPPPPGGGGGAPTVPGGGAGGTPLSAGRCLKTLFAKRFHVGAHQSPPVTAVSKHKPLLQGENGNHLKESAAPTFVRRVLTKDSGYDVRSRRRQTSGRTPFGLRVSRVVFISGSRLKSSKELADGLQMRG